MQLIQAKDLLPQDQNFKKGFKFDHVWPLLKDSEKCADNNSMISPGRRKRHDFSEASQSNSVASNAPGGSFCIDLNAEFESKELSNYNNDSYGRPGGRKKEKMKKKQGEETLQFYKSMKEGNQ